MSTNKDEIKKQLHDYFDMEMVSGLGGFTEEEVLNFAEYVVMITKDEIIKKIVG